MKLIPILFLLLLSLAAATAHAQPQPVGSWVVTFEERFTIEGCAPYRGRGMLGFVMYANGAFEMESEAGTFAGSMRPLDRDPRAFRLLFDDASLSLYALYLQAGANALCDTEVHISGGEIRTALLRITRGGTVSLKLSTTAETSSAIGLVPGRHRLSGTGSVMPFPNSPPIAPETDI